MATNREIYFNLLKKGNKYLTRLVIKALLNDANGFNDEVSLYKHFDEQCLKEEELSEKVKRVEMGESFQYVLGYANFIDQYFMVDKNVLIPRQETEQLVINAKAMIESGFEKDAPLVIADIGTGSGAIAISLKRYFPHAYVYGVDIDEKCLEIAKKNATSLNHNVTFLKGDMLEPLIEKGIKVDFLISNPPYIENKETIDEQVWKYEPHRALLASPSTYFYEEIFKRAREVMKPSGVMVFEIGEDMEDALTDLIYVYFPNASILFSKDLYGKTRFLYIIELGDSEQI